MGKKFSRLPCLLILKPCSAVEVQFTVAPPQHFLYFFREPDGYWSFRPTFPDCKSARNQGILERFV